MNTIKKLVLVVLVLGTVFGVTFGQSIRIDPKSMTALSTADLFTTDVDDFLNVNEFANVMPSKFFGFLGYGSDGKSHIQFGFAKQLKAVYLAGFFGGIPVAWGSKTEPSGDKKKTTIETTNPGGTYDPISTGTLLVGFKNMGISGSFTFKPKANNKRIIDEDAQTDKTDAKFMTNAALRFGINMNGPKDKVYKSYAELSLESNIDKETEKNDKTKITTIKNDSSNALLLNAGTAFDFSQKDDITQSLTVGLQTKWVMPSPKTDIKIVGGTETEYTKDVGAVGVVGTSAGHVITLSPAWTLAYEPEGKFAVKTEASLPLSFDFRSGRDYGETKDASGVKKTYDPTRKHEFYTSFKPSFATAVTYRPISKLCFSLGATFEVPQFGWKTETTQTRKSDGSVTKTEKTVTWTFNDGMAGGKFGGTSGITWFVTDRVTVDGSWNLAKNLLDNKFTTQLTEGDGKSIWDTTNKLLVHNVSFLISFKL